MILIIVIPPSAAEPRNAWSDVCLRLGRVMVCASIFGVSGLCERLPQGVGQRQPIGGDSLPDPNLAVPYAPSAHFGPNRGRATDHDASGPAAVNRVGNAHG